MPSDVDAAVLANTRLSDDYCVVSLEAPEIAAVAQPGQFVMVKPSRGLDPLLRRPFSIFEILRDRDGTPIGVSILNKRIGVGTGLLYELEAGARVACLGPLGQPFVPVDPPAHAWMVAGGVGLAPFLTLAEALHARGTAATLVYGARRAADLHCVDRFERLGIRILLATEDGSAGLKGYVTAAL
ncbi:MAG: dihydroorotate dehydrogenase electron transfer subunit, partial [Vicinamibacterales bacterium]